MTRPGAVEGMTISDVSGLLGIPVPTIRSWERRYGFPSPTRTKGAHRRYDASEVELLRALRDEIAAGVRAETAVESIRGAGGDPEGADLAAAITAAGLAFDASRIRSLLDESVGRLGLDETIASVILPVLREIGRLWEAGRCDVSQEHLTSQEVRAWLAGQVATATLDVSRGTVLLTCGPKDLHTLGLEAFYVLLAKRGIPVRVLGAQTPSDSVRVAAETTRAAAVVVTSHLNVNRRSAIDTLRSLSPLGIDLFFAGNAFAAVRSRRGVPGTYLGRDLGVAAEMIDRSV